jgi:hypothetical protein
MSVIKVSMSYDSATNVYTIEGLKKNPPVEVWAHILDTIKKETDTKQLFDLTVKLVGKDSVETLSLKDFVKRVEKEVGMPESVEDCDTVEEAFSNCIIRLTFYLSNGGMLQAECNLDTARAVMEAYEKPDLRPDRCALFQDIHERHYAIPYDNIIAAYCDFINEGSELHDK